jgi:C4-dicarboxylate-specific signal transduction histidine kinase
MAKTTAALQHLLNQFFEKSDDTSVVTNGKMFRHAAATPLSALLLDLELAHSHQQNQYIYSALTNAHRLKTLFDLTADSIIESKNTAFRVTSAIKETLMILETNHHRSLLRTHIKLSPTATLKGSRFLFQEALSCALKNSLEAYRADQLKLVLITAKETDDQIIIAIIDGGKGFTLWQKTMAFADGFSSKVSHQGIGLSWIKRVISHHFGGKLTIISKPNRGATMTWYLPKDI